jgi:hypothetical protein
MSSKFSPAGIDIGKNSFHIIGLDERGTRCAPAQALRCHPAVVRLGRSASNDRPIRRKAPRSAKRIPAHRAGDLANREAR